MDYQLKIIKMKQEEKEKKKKNKKKLFQKKKYNFYQKNLKKL